MRVKTALAVLLLFFFAVPGFAQVPGSAARPAAVKQVWAEDNWLWIDLGAGWQRTNTYRAFPDRRDPNTFDLFENGHFTKRVHVGVRGWHLEMPAANFAPTSHISWMAYPTSGAVTPATLHVFVNAWGRWTTLAEVQALSGRSGAPAVDYNNPLIAASIVGGTEALGAGRPCVPGQPCR